MEVCRNEDCIKTDECLFVHHVSCMNNENERKCMEMNVSLEPMSAINIIHPLGGLGGRAGGKRGEEDRG